MNVLIVDDEKEIRDKIVRFLKFEKDIRLFTAENGLAAQRVLETERVDLMITDLTMPGLNGLGLLKWMREFKPAIPVVMMSGCGEIGDAVEAMKQGAKDYFVKPFDLEALLRVMRKAHEESAAQTDIESAMTHITDEQTFIGESRVMIDVKALVGHIAPTASTVLIIGESGTGKEVVARMIHRRSPRAQNPFVALNIAGLPETLLESELFGYEKGAFTGAAARRIGLFERASSGTLFLDEIGDLPLHLQVKLLRVLQEREVHPLGSTETVPIDVRIVAATNKPLENMVRDGRFREDLFYRLNIIQIPLPPLRDRKEDIPLLVGHFLKKFHAKIGKTVESIEPEAVRALQNYAFPGNVRELENILERAMIFSQSSTITAQDLRLPSKTPTKVSAKKGALNEIEKQAIIETLLRWEGNRTKTAKELGIDRKTLLNKMKEYGIDGK